MRPRHGRLTNGGMAVARSPKGAREPLYGEMRHGDNKRAIRESARLVRHGEGAGSLDELVQPGTLLKSLLDDPVRFVGSARDELRASMSLEAAHTAHMEVVNEEQLTPTKTADASTVAAAKPAVSKVPRDLYAPALSTTFPRPKMRASGLYNRGNTCYLNSVMQALLATPPLATALLTQSVPTLLGPLGVPRTPKQALKAAHAFSPVAVLKEFFERAYSGAPAVTPAQFVANLRKYAKPLRPGRQEDAHEYLRLLLEALQQTCTAFAGDKIKPNDPILATTFVQKVFGGRLRSRVTCHSCRHNSDTYDPMMDLSLDVRKGIASVKQALDAFTAPESLSGTEKYRCDSCKRRVDATKRFSVDAAPLALTVHLKRFGIFGNKINRPVSYAERLHLGRYMSERQRGLGADAGAGDERTVGAAQQYRLYAVVHHYGSGPNVGHYVASVRAPDGQWLRMDDAHVSRLSHAPLDDPSAYVLFYLREPVAVDAGGAPPMRSPSLSPRKRKTTAPAAMTTSDVPQLPPDALGEPVSRSDYESLVQSRRAPGDSSDEASVDQELALSPKPAKIRRMIRRKKRKMNRAEAPGRP